MNRAPRQPSKDGSREPSAGLAATRLGPGLAAIATLVVIALALNYEVSAVSPLLWAVALGVLAAPVVCARPGAVPGVKFSATWLLRAGVVLVGLRVSASELTQIGVHGVLLAAGTIVSTLSLTVWLGRLLGVPRKLSLLIATGTAICGASAIAAMNSVVHAKEEEVGYAMATITVFGTVAMLLLPPMASGLGLSNEQSGMWIGASVHEVAQVAAAGAAVSTGALAVATLVKLTRVIMLAPTVAAAGVALLPRAKTGARVPGFVLAFLALVALRSVVTLPGVLLDAASSASTALLAAGLAALGLGIRVGPLRQAGLRPLLLGLAASAIAAVVALGLVALPL